MNSTTTRKAGAKAHAFLGTSNSIWEDNLEQGVGFLAFNKMQTFFWISPGMFLTSLFPVDFLTPKKGCTYIAVLPSVGALAGFYSSVQLIILQTLSWPRISESFALNYKLGWKQSMASAVIMRDGEYLRTWGMRQKPHFLWKWSETLKGTAKT